MTNIATETTPVQSKPDRSPGGVLGAKRATWRDVNPRALYFRIADDNPEADKSALEEAFWAEVENDKTHLREIVRYFCDNAHRALVERRAAPAGKPQPPLRPEVRKQMRSVVAKQVVRSVTKKIQIALLTLTMPNGKPLAECTGSECKRFGDWTAKLGDVVPAKVKVGDHLTEEQVQKLWRKTA